MWSRELLREIYEEIHRAAKAEVAPFTRGGKFDHSTPNAVGHTPASRLGQIVNTTIPSGDCHPAGTLGELLDDVFCRLATLEALAGGFGLQPFGTSDFGG